MRLSAPDGKVRRRKHPRQSQGDVQTDTVQSAIEMIMHQKSTVDPGIDALERASPRVVALPLQRRGRQLPLVSKMIGVDLPTHCAGLGVRPHTTGFKALLSIFAFQAESIRRTSPLQCAATPLAALVVHLAQNPAARTSTLEHTVLGMHNRVNDVVSKRTRRTVKLVRMCVFLLPHAACINHRTHSWFEDELSNRIVIKPALGNHGLGAPRADRQDVPSKAPCSDRARTDSLAEPTRKSIGNSCTPSAKRRSL